MQLSYPIQNYNLVWHGTDTTPLILPCTRARENSTTLPAFLTKYRFRRYGNQPSTQHDVTRRRLLKNRSLRENRTEQKGETAAWLTGTKTYPSFAARLAFSDLCNTPHSQRCRCLCQDQAVGVVDHPVTTSKHQQATQFTPWCVIIACHPESCHINETNVHRAKPSMMYQMKTRWQKYYEHMMDWMRGMTEILVVYLCGLEQTKSTNYNWGVKFIYYIFCVYLTILICLPTYMQLVFLLLSYVSFFTSISARVPSQHTFPKYSSIYNGLLSCYYSLLHYYSYNINLIFPLLSSSFLSFSFSPPTVSNNKHNLTPSRHRHVYNYFQNTANGYVARKRNYTLKIMRYETGWLARDFSTLTGQTTVHRR